MSARGPVSCAEFDLVADELALGQVGEPTRGRLLAHAAICPHCHSLLESLGTVADRLLLAAPQVEPPEGFESRVVARLGTAVPARVDRSARIRWIAAAAVVAILVAGAAVALIQRSESASPVATAAIVTDEGAEVGAAQLLAEPTSYLLITVDNPRPGPGLRLCELMRRDGTWELVGQWDAAGIASGVWAVGVDLELLDATAMRITSDGDVVATATFG